MTIKIGPKMGPDHLNRVNLPLKREEPSHLLPTSNSAANAPANKGYCSALNLEALFTEKFSTERKAVFVLHSNDPEFEGIERNGFLGEKKVFIPEPLQKFPEYYEIWTFIREPSTDLAQILRRQTLLESLYKNENIGLLFELKNSSYSIVRGVKDLFERFDTNGYGRMMTALEAYKNGDESFKNNVYDALDKIETGKKALAKLTPLLLNINPTIMWEIVSTLNNHFEKIKHFGEDYFINGDYDQAEAESLSSELLSDLIKIGMFISFALLIKKDNLCKANFDPTKPFGYKNGWQFLRKKENQVQNDSPSDKPLTVLSGSNMSGKSFNLKQNLLIQLLAQSFGYVPCNEGNFNLYDSFFYLDRASTAPAYDLSAFGQEVSQWKEAFSRLGQRPLLFVDEGFSTTSPHDQYKLLKAVSVYLGNRGTKMILASHNEKFIEECQNTPEVGIYHFETVIGKNGEIEYRHKLNSGPSDSMALEVAANLGLPGELIEIARQYLSGDHPAVAARVTPLYHEPKQYSKEEREKLGQSQDTSRFSGKNQEGLFHLFSDDSNFKQDYYSGSDIVTGEDSYAAQVHLRSGGFEGLVFEGGQARKSKLLSLILYSGKLTPQEIIERQNMFAELAANDQFERIRQITNQILTWIIEFSPYCSSSFPMTRAGVLGFNLAINPINEINFYGSNALLSMELVLAYLNLNKKILGNDFPLDHEAKRLRTIANLLGRINDLYAGQRVEEIQKLSEKKDGEGSINAQEIKERFFNLVKYSEKDEPNKEKWGDCVCIKRIKDYIDFIDKTGIDIYERDEFLALVREISAAQMDLEIENEDIRKEFAAIASETEDAQKNVPITTTRILDLADGILEGIRNKELIGKPLFACDVDNISEEYKTFMDSLTVYRKSCNYGHNPNLLPALSFEFAIDQRRYFEELINILRSYNNPILSQYANQLEWLFGRVWFGKKFKDIRDIFTFLQGIYDKEFKNLYEEIYEIEKAFKAKLSEVEIREKAVCLAKIFSLELKDSRGRDKSLESIIFYLKRAMEERFNRKALIELDSSFGKNEAEKLISEIEMITTFALFGRMINQQGFSKVQFNTTGELRIDELRSMVKAREDQIPNSTVFSEDEKVKLYTGPNMSGKTFNLKSLTFAMACALSTGYMPAKVATMPFLDALLYLDRVTSKRDRDLSSFGNEIGYWKEYFELLKDRRLVFACVDEALSTTSPKYQSALTYAITHETIKRGGYLALATHNHDSVDALQIANPEHVQTYHFKYDINDNGDIKFDYKVNPGHEESHAIAVAKKLGMPQEIIDIESSL